MKLKKIGNSISNWFKTLRGKLKQLNKRKVNDGILNGITYLFSSVGIIILLAIIIFIFRNGFSTLSFKLLISDNTSIKYQTKLIEDIQFHDFQDPQLKNVYFSSRWGVGFIDSTNLEGHRSVEIGYIDELSPFINLIDYNNDDYIKIEVGHQFQTALLNGDYDEFIIVYAKDGAEVVASGFDRANAINKMDTITGGGGIRGSIITTIYMILLTVVIALPLGVSAAIYLNEFAPRNRFTKAIRSMIDMTSGIPSIVFGLVGSAVFIPFMNGTIKSDGRSIAAGSLTLTIILLPVIIRTTEEGLRVVPKGYRDASLALGASETQTTFKVVLPNAIGGILAATLLSIGRIIGESAALIYTAGTAIKDRIAINEGSTSLAVHIWTAMAGENPNFELSSAISIVILIVVFSLSIIVKMISKRLDKKAER